MKPAEQIVESNVYYLSRDEVLALHATIVKISASEVYESIRDLGLLESALARPQNAAAYASAHLTRQAATLLYGIIKNHPFRDGNKRTAYVTMQAFLRGNGVSVSSGDDDAYNMIVAIVSGQNDIDDVETWIERTIDPWPESPDQPRRNVGRRTRGRRGRR